jgi:predicted nucleotide-binding protein
METKIIVLGKENINKGIKAIGQELISRADEISNNIENVNAITINAVLTPAEIVNFDITKNYIAQFKENDKDKKDDK